VISLSLDAADGDIPYRSDQTMLAKWNGIPDTGGAPRDHREYRIWHDEAQSRWRFELSADGLEGPEHSASVTHPTAIDRGQLYLLEAWHDAEQGSVNLRVSTQEERSGAESAPWTRGVFAGGADLDVGAQTRARMRTCKAQSTPSATGPECSATAKAAPCGTRALAWSSNKPRFRSVSWSTIHGSIAIRPRLQGLLQSPQGQPQERMYMYCASPGVSPWPICVTIRTRV
jgi:hypothetical protein